MLVDTLLQPISKSQKSYLSLKRQMWKTEHFLFRWTLWVLTQIYSKTRVYWNCLSQSVSKFLQRQPIPTHYLPEMLRLILKEPSRTYFTSCHPPNVKKGFVKGEALRILRKNSSETTFEENDSNLKKNAWWTEATHNLW